MNFDSNHCDICGKPRGRTYNHDACSKKRQELRLAADAKSKPRKAVSKRNMEEYAKYLSTL